MRYASEYSALIEVLSRALDDFFYFCVPDKRSLITSEEEEKNLFLLAFRRLLFVSFSALACFREYLSRWE